MDRIPRILSAAYSWLIFGFLYIPIVLLVALSFNAARRGVQWEGFTLRWYRDMLADRLLREATVNSLVVAFWSTLLAAIIGTMAAMALDRYRPSGRTGKAASSGTRLLLYLPIIVPEIVLGVSLLALFGLIRMQLSMETVILAHVVFTVSYVTVVVKARLAGLDRTLEEAAMDLGAGPVGTFMRVTLPQLLPGIGAASLLAFTISLDDYVVTSLVAGPESTTLPIQIYSMLRTEVTPKVNAVCSALLLFTIVLIIAAQWLSPIAGEQRAKGSEA